MFDFLYIFITAFINTLLSLLSALPLMADENENHKFLFLYFLKNEDFPGKKPSPIGLLVLSGLALTYVLISSILVLGIKLLKKRGLKVFKGQQNILTLDQTFISGVLNILSIFFTVFIILNIDNQYLTKLQTRRLFLIFDLVSTFYFHCLFPCLILLNLWIQMPDFFVNLPNGKTKIFFIQVPFLEPRPVDFQPPKPFLKARWGSENKFIINLSKSHHVDNKNDEIRENNLINPVEV